VTETSLSKKDFGTQVWLSVQSNEEAVVAVSSLVLSEKFRGKIEFYKVMRVATTSGGEATFKVYEYDKIIQIQSSLALSSASFVSSDFVYVPTPGQGP